VAKAAIPLLKTILGGVAKKINETELR
jgi:hypothetical protein